VIERLNLATDPK